MTIPRTDAHTRGDANAPRPVEVREQALREQALREQALREQALREQALRERADHDLDRASRARRNEGSVERRRPGADPLDVSASHYRPRRRRLSLPPAATAVSKLPGMERATLRPWRRPDAAAAIARRALRDFMRPCAATARPPRGAMVSRNDQTVRPERAPRACAPSMRPDRAPRRPAAATTASVPCIRALRPCAAAVAAAKLAQRDVVRRSISSAASMTFWLTS